MKLIVGLGNMGDEYEKTRHNLGWFVLEQLIARLLVSKKEIKFRSEIIFATYKNQKVILLKPQTYMNLSGEAVLQVMNYYKLSIDDLLIVYDDKDLNFGKHRFRNNGSAGGHNGIKNIIVNLKTQNFFRLRIGIGYPPSSWTIANWVMSKITEQEFKILYKNFDLYVGGIFDFICGVDVLKIMNKYNW